MQRGSTVAHTRHQAAAHFSVVSSASKQWSCLGGAVHLRSGLTGSGLGFGIHPQRKLLSWCDRDGRWLLHTRPGEKIGESKERRKGVLGRRAETITSESWRREEDLREERVCGEVPLTCVLGGLPIFLLGDKQVASNMESQPVFYLALTQKKGSVSFGLPLSGCRERDQLVPDLTV